MECVVLGAGPIGLVAAHLLEADVVVADRVGGSGIRRFAPTFLWRTRATERLLAELEIPANPRVVRFGYLDENGVRATFEGSDLLEYYRRSRGIDPGEPVDVPGSAMSSGSSGAIETFDVSVDDLVAALLRRVEVTVGAVNVVEITRSDGRMVPKVRVAVENGREFWTRQLVNTLPAPVFDSVVTHRDVYFRAARREWPVVEKTFVRVPFEAVVGELRRARDELGLAYVYVVSPDRDLFAYDRVTFLDDVAVLEFNRPESVPVGAEWEGFERFSARLQIRGASRDPVEYAGTVWHVGRLARWSHSIRIHDVVEELYGCIGD